jgi:hypothetical protein
MYYTVTDARYVRDFTIWATFADGSAGEIDLADELCGPIFEPLKDVNYFRSFSLAEYGTIAWPNGADITSEFLCERFAFARDLPFGPWLSLGHSEGPTPQNIHNRCHLIARWLYGRDNVAALAILTQEEHG